MGDGGKGAGEGGRDCAGMGDDIKGGGTDSVSLRQQELGSDVCYAEGDGGIPPQSGLEDLRDYSSESQGWGMGVVIGGRGLGGGGSVANEGVYLEAAGYH